MEKNMHIFEELQARGLLAQLTDEDQIRDLVNNGKATFYIGFDPRPQLRVLQEADEPLH